jgi:hypothetical protein
VNLVKTSALFFKRRYRVVHVNNMPDFLVSRRSFHGCSDNVILDIHDPMPNTFASEFGSVQESDGTRDFSGVGFSAKTGTVAVVAVGMWKPAFGAGLLWTEAHNYRAYDPGGW